MIHCYYISNKKFSSLTSLALIHKSIGFTTSGLVSLGEPNQFLQARCHQEKVGELKEVGGGNEESLISSLKYLSFPSLGGKKWGRALKPPSGAVLVIMLCILRFCYRSIICGCTRSPVHGVSTVEQS